MSLRGIMVEAWPCMCVINLSADRHMLLKGVKLFRQLLDSVGVVSVHLAPESGSNVTVFSLSVALLSTRFSVCECRCLVLFVDMLWLSMCLVLGVLCLMA